MQFTPKHTRMNAFPGRRQLLMLTFAFEGALLLLALALGYFVNVPFWQDIGDTNALVIGLVLAAPVIGGVILLTDKTTRRFRELRRDFEHVVRLFENSTILDLLFVSLLAGICEEALFRGFLQNWLLTWGEGRAVIVTALVFGLAHAISLQYFFFATLISVYLSLTYIYTGALVAPVALHAAYDFAMLVYGTRYWAGRQLAAD